MPNTLNHYYANAYGLNIEAGFPLDNVFPPGDATGKVDVSLIIGKIPKEIEKPIYENNYIKVSKSELIANYPDDIKICIHNYGSNIILDSNAVAKLPKRQVINAVTSYTFAMAIHYINVHSDNITIPIHANTIIDSNGDAVMIIGRSKTGKSTWCANLYYSQIHKKHFIKML